MKLIDKDKVVAEVKKIYDTDYKFLPSDIVENIQDFKDDLLTSLDTLEVKEVDIEDVVHGTVDFPLIGHDFPNIYPNYKELKEYCDRKGIKDDDKVKLIIIKDM